MKVWYKIALFLAVSVAFIGCDRVTKALAKEQLMDKAPRSYFHDTFRLEYIENTGAALGFGEHLAKSASFWLLGILPLIALLILFGYTIRKAKEMPLPKMICVSLIFAGGVGNIIDRLFFDRHVSDFMNIGFMNIRTAIFNFADLYITIGVIAFILLFRNRQENIVIHPENIALQHENITPHQENLALLHENLTPHQENLAPPQEHITPQQGTHPE